MHLVILASSNDAFRQKFGDLLDNQNDMTTIERARTGLEAAIKALTETPSILIIDKNIPLFNSRIVDWIHEKAPQITVVLLAVNGNANPAPVTSKSGDKLYSLQGADPARLAEAVQVIACEG